MPIQSRSLALIALLFSTTLALSAFAANTTVSLEADELLGASERMSESVSRLDLDADEKSVALAVDEVGKQHEGLLGFAVHPEIGMGKDHDFVYVAYTSAAVEDSRIKIVQYHWDAEAGVLVDPVDLPAGFPAGKITKRCASSSGRTACFIIPTLYSNE